MTEDQFNGQFAKLFRYMNERFDAIERRFDQMATKESVDNLTNLLIDNRARIDTIEQENLVRDAQFSRFVGWGHKVGDKVKIPLEDL